MMLDLLFMNGGNVRLDCVESSRFDLVHDNDRRCTGIITTPSIDAKNVLI